jgi:hypothetical protein
MAIIMKMFISCSALPAAALLLICLLNPSVTEAAKAKPFSTKDKMRIEASGVFGRGLDYEMIGYTYGTNEPIRLSAGGGAGPNLSVGFGKSKYLDIDVTAGLQTSANRLNVWNSETTFERKYLLGTFKLKFPMKTKEGQVKKQAKLGVGAGYYFGATMLSTYESPHSLAKTYTEIKYKDTIGYHMTAEFEIIYPSNWSFVVGLRAYYVMYEQESYSYNGPDPFPASTLENYEQMNGSGLDLKIGIGKYL